MDIIPGETLIYIYIAVRCYDIFGDCIESLENDQDYCEKNENGEALRGCAKTCGRCVDLPGTPVGECCKVQPHCASYRMLCDIAVLKVGFSTAEQEQIAIL